MSCLNKIMIFMKHAFQILTILVAMFTLQSFTTQPASGGTTVYVTPNGNVYHSTKTCRSLSRSTSIKAIPLSQAKKTRRACKICY